MVTRCRVLLTANRFPELEAGLKKIADRKNSIYSAFVKRYLKDKGEKYEAEKELEEQYDVRKYAVCIDDNLMISRICHATCEKLRNPLMYSEIEKVCGECVERGMNRDPRLPYLPIFKVCGVRETVNFLAELPNVWNKEHRDRYTLVVNFFQAVARITR